RATPPGGRPWTRPSGRAPRTRRHPSAFPEAHGRLAQGVVAGERPARRRPVEASLHALRQGAVLHHLDEQGGGVAEVEPVALPRPLEITGIAEPAAADARDLVGVAVGAGGVGDLAPEADDLALAVVDEDLLVG